ncbi:hypothetical protein AN639_10510 [Candidatus Epulonipiscium fishelsonii]|uniref:Uncharacterized protein n=1 Tax=Candidatus Epulonipiscium fishelsonii TaxID=77094 RepID=A0ACC8XBF4_9FIRM|nr:hypothetical protein AN396_07030 [Epulopiscium sp. SCG-B11WGA-EpuloA1]ONI43443.1 hypothetical protein AN639_10510 [Epulopiscium sp. SCG-B05WGA-EpuloA1]
MNKKYIPIVLSFISLSTPVFAKENIYAKEISDVHTQEELLKSFQYHKPEKNRYLDNSVVVEITDESNPLLDNFAYEIIELVNFERAKVGANPLKLDAELNSIAQIKSEDMKKNNYFNHTSPVFGTPLEMLDKFGVEYLTANENIAMGQSLPVTVVGGWMSSEFHRSNILNKYFTHMGIGLSEDGNYWTQLFKSVV